MNAVKVDAPAKLTLRLRIVGVRADGYHLLDAEMVTIDLADTLEFTEGDGLAVEGPASAGVPLDSANLVARALEATGRRARVRLVKRICLVGGRARVSGTGEVVTPLDFDQAAGRRYTLLIPPFGVSTAAAFRAWDDLGGPAAEGPNDLEPAALVVEPRLAAWRHRLGDASGTVPSLAGSGSTWFVEGAFPGDDRVVVRVARPSDEPGGAG
jgi:4-diphosphocytidyl-2-C-methyl-D-erythritol kinase